MLSEKDFSSPNRPKSTSPDLLHRNEGWTPEHFAQIQEIHEETRRIALMLKEAESGLGDIRDALKPFLDAAESQTVRAEEGRPSEQAEVDAHALLARLRRVIANKE